MLTHGLLFPCDATVSVKTRWHFGSEYLAQYECDENNDEMVKLFRWKPFSNIMFIQRYLRGD